MTSPVLTTTDWFELTIPGTPVGKGRAKFGKGRVYTPRATVVAENLIRWRWELAGKPRLPDGPVQVSIVLVVDRPKSHYTSKGDLTHGARRMPYPHKQKPDCDNAIKLLLDSMNGYGWRDDVQIVTLNSIRRWVDGTSAADGPCTVLTAWTLNTEQAAA